MDTPDKKPHQEIKHPGLQVLQKIARRLNAPHWLFDYSCMRLLQIPQLDSFHYFQEGYSVKQATKCHCLAMANCRSMTDPQEGQQLFSKRLDQGAIGYILLDKTQKVVGYAWVSCKEILFEDDDRYKLSCNPQQAYVFDTFLHPDTRGKNLYGLLISLLGDDLLARDKREQLFVLVDQSNLISLKAHYKLGAQLKETCSYVAVLGICRYTLTASRQVSCFRRFHTKTYCESLFLNGH